MRPSPEQFAATVRAFGISNNTRVVTYSTTSPQWASRVLWLLREFGHDNAALLDGGWKKWSAETRPTETGAGSARAPGTFSPKQGV